MQCYVISSENLSDSRDFFTIRSAGSFRSLQKLTGTNSIRNNGPLRVNKREGSTKITHNPHKVLFYPQDVLNNEYRKTRRKTTHRKCSGRQIVASTENHLRQI